jgi:hypothetical protein
VIDRVVRNLGPRSNSRTAELTQHAAYAVRALLQSFIGVASLEAWVGIVQLAGGFIEGDPDGAPDMPGISWPRSWCGATSVTSALRSTGIGRTRRRRLHRAVVAVISLLAILRASARLAWLIDPDQDVIRPFFRRAGLSSSEVSRRYSG